MTPWLLALSKRTSRRHEGPFPLGAFQGDLIPLSSWSVLEACVIPVLHYGSENWILTENLVDRLEALQAELVKRALKWPKHLSNTAAVTVLDVP